MTWRMRAFEHPGRMRPFLAIACVAALALWAVHAAWTSSSQHPSHADPRDIALQFCVPVPPEARVMPMQQAAVERHVLVPVEVPAHGASSSAVAARRGDVVRLTVESPVGGAVGVHGISDIEAIHPGETVRIAFRAIHAGRFPLHFHGVDGSHFEILALEVHD